MTDPYFQPVIPGRLRRNGTRPSCENCRIAKARCDHNAPCGRCSRTGKTCFFHPCPMSNSSRTKRSPHTTSETLSPNGEKGEGARKTRSNSEPAPTRNPPKLHTGIRSYTNRAERLSLGYMGSTSHAAILAENGGHPILESLDDVPEDSLMASSSNVEESAMKIAMAIFAWFPSQAKCDRVIGFSTSIVQGTSSFMQMRVTRNFIRTFWDTFGHLLKEPRRQDNLRQLCSMLIANTKAQLPYPKDNEEFIRSFSGPRSRWEPVGQFFITFGSLLFSVPDTSPTLAEILPENTDKKSYVCSMLECADSCLILSEELALSGNLLGMGLFQQCVQLQSMVAGDSNFDLWKRLGCLVAGVMGLGLHLKASPAESQSSLYHELRTRVLTATISLDKMLSTFVGRPPLLSRRYVSCELPLDLSEEEIWECSDISILRQRLDSDGWNLEPKISLSTTIRGMMMMNQLRDEILELSLTTLKPPDLSDQVDQLAVRLDNTYRQLPDAFHATITRQSFSEKNPQDIRFIASIQLYHWHNVFLCERINNERRDHNRFLLVAGQMLSMVNLYWSERDRYPSHRDVCHWWICCFGIPAASALATDLWKQTTSPMTHPASQSRPYIIQDLHLFIASLDWIDSGCGNYKLCQRIKTMLNDLLIRILNPNSPSISVDPLVDFDDWTTSNLGLSSFPAFDFDDMTAWFNVPSMI